MHFQKLFVSISNNKYAQDLHMYSGLFLYGELIATEQSMLYKMKSWSNIKQTLSQRVLVIVCTTFIHYMF